MVSSYLTSVISSQNNANGKNFFRGSSLSTVRVIWYPYFHRFLYSNCTFCFIRRQASRAPCTLSTAWVCYCSNVYLYYIIASKYKVSCLLQKEEVIQARHIDTIIYFCVEPREKMWFDSSEREEMSLACAGNYSCSQLTDLGLTPLTLNSPVHGLYKMDYI